MALPQGMKEAPDAALRSLSPGSCHPSLPKRKRALWIYTSVRWACDSPHSQLRLMLCCRRCEILNNFLAMAPPIFILHWAPQATERGLCITHSLAYSSGLTNTGFFVMRLTYLSRTLSTCPASLVRGPRLSHVWKSGEMYDWAHGHSASSRREQGPQEDPWVRRSKGKKLPGSWVG